MKSLAIVTPAATYPVTSAEAKLYAKIDTTADDTLIDIFIAAATSAAEEHLKRALITQTLRLTLDLHGGALNDILGDGVYELPVSYVYGDLPRVIKLPKQPIQSITSVKLYDTSNAESTYSSSNYFLDSDGGRLVLNNTAIWDSDLRPQAACKITYVAGYGAVSDVPVPIKTAILMHIQKMYDERIVCDMPQSCAALLDRFKVYDL